MPATCRAHGALLQVLVSPVADPATVFYSLRVPVRPVHEATLLVPLVNPAKPDPVPHADRHALRQVEVVGDQQRLATRQLHDEALVPPAVIIVGDQADDDAGAFYPAIVVGLAVVRRDVRITLR